ncbi:conserved hypothetical protein [Talaromyces stipitatus ATCC 10500]|uniref:Uncharacterized protein n=1 Tax=Talaromyces stipitatus (strain ATCC 10500 / CBS 375.48 / QM 6759 / NRRL 1006) TaxID=441959 RepID=B8MUB2_TALSN|nr:uncharacterized protein TSTA_108060 [Talaromyces stipitatus ATCC 10500]EED11616.1 conserved hypothetical protein [Talaromyces stipitatus ATCC 10500]
MQLLVILFSLFASTTYHSVAMSYSFRQDDNISPQPYDSWDNDLLYAPTPGNFSTASSPPIHSPQPTTFLEYPSQREPQSDQLCFVPPTLWEKDKTYDEHPPIYLHYLIDWKVKLNNRTITKVTEPDVVLAPGAYWQKVLREKVERVKSRKVFSDRRARLEETTVVASVLNDRSQKLHQQAEGIDIDWGMTGKQLLEWKELFRRGKKLRLDVCVNYVADDNEQSSTRNGEKRNTRSVTNAMLAEREARIDAEQSSGQSSPWRDVYDKMKCPGPPCKNSEGYCWQDPVGKKHYRLNTHHLTHLVDMVKKKRLFLETHDDVPEMIREQLYAEERLSLERKKRPKGNSLIEAPYLPININVLSTPSPQPSIVATPAGSPPSVLHTHSKSPSACNTLLSF